LELATGAGDQKTRIIGLPGWERSLTISSAVWIQCINVTRTDRRYGHLGDKSTGRQTTGRHILVNWATTLEECFKMHM